MKILIVGANFNNKGAQSMLFTLVNEIKLRNESAQVYFASDEYLEITNYNFQHILFNQTNKALLLNPKKSSIKIKRLLKDVAKVVLGKISLNNLKSNWNSFKDTQELLPKVDLVIDISGYSIGDKFNILPQLDYINNIKIARKFKVPMILFPQSFGPFNYSKEKQCLIQEIQDNFKYCKKIFVREEKGLRDLEKLGLSNVEWSPDLVLQSNKINTDRILINKPKLKEFKVQPNSIAIIPNAQCFRFGDVNQIRKLYFEIINEILKKNDYVYLVRHSNDDLKVCQEIKDLFPNDSRVVLLSEDINCIEYESLIDSFNFIICSRYHGIVHAYRQGIPTIILGWEEKYDSLASMMKQSKYNFDIVNGKINIENVISSVKDMEENYLENSKILKKSLEKIQDYNCFRILDQFL